MASGFSRRLGEDKLTLRINGLACIERVIKAVIHSDIGDVILVYRDNKVKEIADKYKLKTVYNRDAEKGQSSSIKTGINVSQPSTTGFLFITGDQPFLACDVINKIINGYKANLDYIMVPLYDGNKGSPVLFPREFRKDLLKLNGDFGGKEIIKANSNRVKYIDIPDARFGIDIDTIEDYKKVLKLNNLNGGEFFGK